MGVESKSMVYSSRLGEVRKSNRRVDGISGRAKVGLVVLGGDLCEVRGSKGILYLGYVCLSW